MHGHGEKIARKWEQAIAGLLSQGTIARAAQAAKINEGTLRRWLKDPGFKQAYYQARNDLLQQSLGLVAEGLVHGTIVLRQVLHDPEAPASAKVAAVRLLFDLAWRDRDTESLEQQLAALRADVEVLRAQVSA